jgi:hypothetical protein
MDATELRSASHSGALSQLVKVALSEEGPLQYLHSLDTLLQLNFIAGTWCT